MAFWGVEVKPGKPITHYCEKSRGRLRISQATLGYGEATKKSIVQCIVGNRRPVLLCVLLPDKTESCHLDLEFEEADDVVFAVVGPRSVYLTGYYVQRSRRSDSHIDDTESYGVDIENTRSDGSSYFSDDDKYEDSFISDNNDLRVSSQSPVLSSKGMDETMHENDTPKDKKVRGGQLNRRFEVIESDDDANSHENEDEDGYSLSALEYNRAMETTMSDAGDNIMKMGEEAKGDGVCGIESTQTVDPLDNNGKLEGVTKPPLNEEGTEVRDEKNELPKEVEILEEIIVPSKKFLTGDTNHANNAKDTIISASLPMSNEKDQMRSLDLEKPKNKRKERSKKEKNSCDVQTDYEDPSVLREGKEHEAATPSKMVTKSPLNEEGTEVRDEKNELPKEVEILEETIVPSKEVLTGDINHANNAKDTIITTWLPMSNEKDQMQSLDPAKPKKKRKARSKKEKKSCDVHTNNEDPSVLREGKEHEVETPTKMDSGANSVDGHKSKKRMNELQLEGANIEGINEKCHNILDDGKFEQGFLHADNLTEDLLSENKENQEQQRLEKIRTEQIGTESQGRPREDKSDQVLLHADSTKEDLPAENGENQEQQIDNIISKINKEILAGDSSQLEKKTKKKKKKTQVKKDLNMGMTNVKDSKEITPMEIEDQTTNAVPIQKRTLSNGLIIEELVSGPPNGKVATPGKTVKIYYTAMLKESGHVFDSNMETAFKFRLGDEEFIDGWNVGIDGMRVGDKRRLIIPPSMGFGDYGMGEDVRPNSWLVYDVELLGVRK